jgi:hypothetical protein
VSADRIMRSRDVGLRVGRHPDLPTAPTCGAKSVHFKLKPENYIIALKVARNYIDPEITFSGALYVRQPDDSRDSGDSRCGRL